MAWVRARDKPADLTPRRPRLRPAAPGPRYRHSTTVIAKNIATEIVLARQKIGFPQFVEQAIIRALYQAVED
jgi:hypothetical protein